MAAEIVRLYVGGIPDGIAEADLAARFKPFGECRAVSAPPSPPAEALPPPRSQRETPSERGS